MSATPEEEAYLVGCLYGRGSIEIGTHGQYDVYLRIPYREYSEVQTTIVNILQKHPTGFTFRELLRHPSISGTEITPGQLVTTLRKLRFWSPPHKETYANMIARDASGRWRIKMPTLVKKFFEWQQRYYNRDIQNMRFILRHLRRIATFLSRITLPIENEDRSVFGITYFGIKCEISEFTFDQLKEKYQLDLGDVYRHARIPDSIFSFDDPAAQEFIRGLADCEGDFDVSHIPDLYRVQFSVVNENRRFATDLCRYLQVRLNIPVYYIDWAIAGETKRGSRDQLIKIFVPYFDAPYFPQPLFYNRLKQVQLREYIKLAKRAHASVPGRCPRRSRAKYKEYCKRYGCLQIGD